MTAATSIARHEHLLEELGRARTFGVVSTYEKTNPTGNKVQWVIGFDGNGDESVTFETRELDAFLRGIRLASAAAARPGAKRPPKLTPTRRAILEDGRVEVELRNPGDAAELKRRRNGLFSDAYALGLKGQFHVTKDGDRLIGETEEYRQAHAAEDAPVQVKESA